MRGSDEREGSGNSVLCVCDSEGKNGSFLVLFLALLWVKKACSFFIAAFSFLLMWDCGIWSFAALWLRNLQRLHHFWTCNNPHQMRIIPFLKVGFRHASALHVIQKPKKEIHPIRFVQLLEWDKVRRLEFRYIVK